jgi:hypothetical protein
MKHLTSILPDALMIGGAAALSYGASLVYFPAGFIVAGLLLMTAGVLAARVAK